MSLFLVRYGELGLKSPKVKKRFQKMLKKNIEDTFLKEDTQCITSMDWGRIYLHTDDDTVAKEVLRKTFGITSFSKVVECSSDLEEICETAAKFSKQEILKNSTFAVRAKRVGEHEYTSQDVAKEVGSAILSVNKEKNLKVNLSKPDTKIYVEVRHNRAFIFSEKIRGVGGFPIGTQGKVLAVISDRKSLYAAWLMMKRGCSTKLLCLDEEALDLAKSLEPWGLTLKPILINQENNYLENALGMANKIRAEALVLGYTFEEYKNMEKINAEIPIFYPLIGMPKEEMDKKIIFLFDDGS